MDGFWGTIYQILSGCDDGGRLRPRGPVLAKRACVSVAVAVLCCYQPIGGRNSAIGAVQFAMTDVLMYAIVFVRRPVRARGLALTWDDLRRDSPTTWLMHWPDSAINLCSRERWSTSRGPLSRSLR